jgi:hypothetical protein
MVTDQSATVVYVSTKTWGSPDKILTLGKAVCNLALPNNIFVLLFSLAKIKHL